MPGHRTGYSFHPSSSGPDTDTVVVVCVMFYFLSLVCPCFIFYLCGE